MRAPLAIFAVAAIAPSVRTAPAALADGGGRRSATFLGRRFATFLGLTSKQDSIARIEEHALVEPEGPPPSPELVKVSQEWYLIERVGVQDSRGGQQPRSPLASNANVCLTKGDADDLQGDSLVWEPCQDSYLAGSNGTKINSELQERQMFKFRLDGKIQAKAGGRCVRHIECGDQSIYDLGNCKEEDFTVHFKVSKAVANSVDHLKPMGMPAQAIASDSNCDFCGPYQVTERCPGRRLPDGGCQKNWAAQPGWTKLGTQYLGDMASIGRSDVRDPLEFAAGIVRNIRNGGILDNDRSGFGPVGATGTICGSGSTEAPGSRSFFYFIREGAETEVNYR